MTEVKVQVWVDGEEIDLAPIFKLALTSAAKRKKKEEPTPVSPPKAEQWHE